MRKEQSKLVNAVMVLYLLLTFGCSPQKTQPVLTPAEVGRIDRACSIEWIIEALSEAKSEGYILDEVQQRCLRFEMDEVVENRLAASGASPSLIASLYSVCVITEDRLINRAGSFPTRSAWWAYALGFVIGMMAITTLY